MSVRRTFARVVALPAAVAGFGLLAVAPALGHVSISTDNAAAGSFTVATVSVPHGCEGSPTTSVTIKIPSEINSVTPTRNALWNVKKNVVALSPAIEDAHGNEITERVDTVVYTAKTPLPDGYRDAFELSFQVPDVAGETLVFPTLQKCVKGQTNWNQVAQEGAEEPKSPAPSITVTEASGDDHHGGATTEESEHAADEAAEHEAAESLEATSSKSESDSASKGLAYTGLGVGIIGLLTAVAALAKGRKA